MYTYCRHWRKDGIWQALHTRLRGWTRAAGRPESPSEVILDRQTVPTVAMVQQAVRFDRFKATKGRKRHWHTPLLFKQPLTCPLPLL
ncbi:MAG: hypothetical protein KME27_26400 [Lyngbya sp. HA4199-MV5]|nr:hypothetical protein [Lyngbya sp. HA4199-MV5]